MSAFNEMAEKLSHRPGVENPRALAAYIGDKKYGKAGMAEKAARAKKAQERGLDKLGQ